MTSINGKVLGGLSVAVVVIAAVGAVFYFTTSRVIADAKSVDHTHKVIHTLTDFYTQLQDAGIAARGYVTTNNPKFLPPYERATARVKECLHQLHPLTEDNETEQQLLAQVEPLATRKLMQL